MEERRIKGEHANQDVGRSVSLVGMTIATFTFLLTFLYPRYVSGSIDPTLFQISLAVIGFGIFFLVYAGLDFYIAALPWSGTGDEADRFRRKGDRFWLVGYSLLLLEPSLVLFTVNLVIVGLVWLGLWVWYLYRNVSEYRRTISKFH